MRSGGTERVAGNIDSIPSRATRRAGGSTRRVRRRDVGMKTREASEDLPLVVHIPIQAVREIVILIHAREGKPVVIDTRRIVAWPVRRPNVLQESNRAGIKPELRNEIAGKRRPL